jgi:hypothetical protein
MFIEVRWTEDVFRNWAKSLDGSQAVSSIDQLVGWSKDVDARSSIRKYGDHALDGLKEVVVELY